MIMIVLNTDYSGLDMPTRRAENRATKTDRAASPTIGIVKQAAHTSPHLNAKQFSSPQ